MTTATELPRWTRVAAYALATDVQERVLLVRVAAGYPQVGRWTLPGGGLEFGEEPAAGALRELTEETGLTGRVTSIAFVDSRTWPPRPEINLGEWHAVRIVYRVENTGGKLRDELDESSDTAAWLIRGEARKLPLVDLSEKALDHLDTETRPGGGSKPRPDPGGTPGGGSLARSRLETRSGGGSKPRPDPGGTPGGGSLARSRRETRPGGGR